MSDVLGILCSSICVIYVLIRTAIIDRTTPWFEDDMAPARAANKDRHTVSNFHGDRALRK